MAACGPLPSALPYLGVITSVEAGPEVPADAPAFVINPGYGLQVPYGAIGITTSGSAWSLAWQSEVASRRYSGDVYAPPDAVLFSLGGSAESFASLGAGSHHLHFELIDERGLPQSLSFRTTRGPLAFRLQIDGIATQREQVVFASGHQLATIDAPTFRLFAQFAQ